MNAMILAPELPVAVIGAGPVGLAAAAHLVRRGIRPLIFERGAEVGASLLEWAHVRVFSPWRYNIDAAARALLERIGLEGSRRRRLCRPAARSSRDYLRRSPRCPQIAANLKLGATVTGITREGHDKVWSNEGATRPPS